MSRDPIRALPLGEQLVTRLRSMVVRGELRPGTHVVEGSIAEEYGVSRGPVRDALRQLVVEGLVEPGRRGVRVRGLTDTDLWELYTLRGVLEGAAIRRCIELATSGEVDWTSLDEAVTTMRAAARERDPATFAAADLDFHSAFHTLAGNRRVAAVWATQRPLFAAMLDVTNTVDRDLGPVADAHARLADIVRGGDIDAALAELSTHLDSSRERMRVALADVVRGSAAS